MTGRTAVYRLFDASDVLLYIGVTDNPDRRFASHEALKPWWPDVARKAIEWHDTRDLAEAAEDEAIQAEHALYNVARSPWAPKPRELGDDEVLIGAARANLSEVVGRVRLLRKVVIIAGPTRDRRPRAAIVPAELGEAVIAAGGPDAALSILRNARER